MNFNFPSRMHPFYPVPRFETKLVKIGEEVTWRDDIGRHNREVRQNTVNEMGQGPFMVLTIELGHVAIRNAGGATTVVPQQWIEPNCDGA